MNAPDRTAASQAVFANPRSSADGDFERLVARTFTPRDLLEDNNFDKIWRMAEALANSALSVPKELKGNIGDCMAIVTQAMIWGLNPFAVAQKAHVINGRLGYEAQLVNAVVMQSGAIQGSFQYEYNGDSCRVGAVLRGEQQVTWGEWLSASTVAVKNSPLWKTNPKQQMGYLQVKNWARAYCPGALLGVYSADELIDDLPPAGEATGARAPAPSPARPALPVYSDADFEAKFPAWATLVTGEDGKTAQALLTKLSTRAAFTEPQRARILSIRPHKPAPDAVAAASATPAPNPPTDPATAAWVSDMQAAEAGAK